MPLQYGPAAAIDVPSEPDELFTEEARTGLHPNPAAPPPAAPSPAARRDQAFLVMGVSSTLLSVVVLLGAIGVLSGAFPHRAPAPPDPGLVPVHAAGRVAPTAFLAPRPAPAPRRERADRAEPSGEEAVPDLPPTCEPAPVE